MKQPALCLPARGAHPLLLDGAMGTELLRAGYSAGTCLEALVLSAPEKVRRIHVAYREAGADIISTATFGANRYRLQAHGLQERAAELNTAAVRVARAAGDGPIAGTIGPSGLREFEDGDGLRSAFREQALALEGVDLFLLETFGDVTELRLAVLAVHEVATVPVVAQMSFGADGNTLAGQSVQAVMAMARNLSIAALGINCAIDTDTIDRLLPRFAALADLPLSAEPNAGLPDLTVDPPVYPVSPADFAAQVARLAPHASLIGGCCGTSPDHIRAARITLDAIASSDVQEHPQSAPHP